MKKVFIVIFVFTFFLSCEKKEENFSDEMLEKLDVVDNGIPSQYGFLQLFVYTGKNEFTETNNNYLFIFYKLHYKKEFKSFKNFLNAVLNEDYRIDINLFRKVMYIETFKLNPKIENEYSKLGFSEFLKIYSEKTSSSTHELKLKKSIINDGEYQSVVYYLYKNKYDLAIDCHIGNDYIVKREDYFKPLK